MVRLARPGERLFGPRTARDQRSLCQPAAPPPATTVRGSRSPSLRSGDRRGWRGVRCCAVAVGWDSKGQSPAAPPPATSGAKRLAAGALEAFIVDPQSPIYSRAAGALRIFTQSHRSLINGRQRHADPSYKQPRHRRARPTPAIRRCFERSTVSFELSAEMKASSGASSIELGSIGTTASIARTAIRTIGVNIKFIYNNVY